jgi:hypothetical protein
MKKSPLLSQFNQIYGGGQHVTIFSTKWVYLLSSVNRTRVPPLRVKAIKINRFAFSLFFLQINLVIFKLFQEHVEAIEPYLFRSSSGFWKNAAVWYA